MFINHMATISSEYHEIFVNAFVIDFFFHQEKIILFDFKARMLQTEAGEVTV